MIRFYDYLFGERFGNKTFNALAIQMLRKEGRINEFLQCEFVSVQKPLRSETIFVNRIYRDIYA